MPIVVPNATPFNSLPSFNTIDDLRAVSPGAYPSVEVLSNTTLGDGMGGLYYWASASTATDDDATVVQPNLGGTGRWLYVPGLFIHAGTAAVVRDKQDKLRETYSFKEAGAVADATGVTGVGTDSTAFIQAAMDYCSANGVTLRGTSGIYRITSSLLVDSNLHLVMDPDCVIFVDTAAITGSGGWLQQRDWTSEVAISNLHISGGELRGRTDWSTDGNAVQVFADDSTIENLKIRYFGNTGRAMVICGSHLRVSGIKATDPYIVANGGGGIRYIGGDDYICSDSHVECDDDCFQIVPGIPANTNGDMSTSNAHYVNCTGISNRARLIVVAASDGTATGGMTCSISGWSFVAVSGAAPVDSSSVSAGIAIANDDSTGNIERGTLVGCHVDCSTGQSTRAIDIRNIVTGNVRDIDFFGCSIKSPYARAIEIRTAGGTVPPYKISWNGGLLDAPRTSDNTVTVREGTRVVFNDARIVGCATHGANVVNVGSSTTSCDGVFFSKCRIEEIGDTGAARYGIQWSRCAFGGSERCAYIPASGTTNSKAILGNANSSNITVYGDDLSQVTATAATRINLNGVSNFTAKDCKGFVTRSTAGGTVASGATTAVVSHGLNVTPGSQNISGVIFTSQGTNDYGRWSVGSFTSTQTTLTVASDPGAGGVSFSITFNAEKLS